MRVDLPVVDCTNSDVSEVLLLKAIASDKSTYIAE